MPVPLVSVLMAVRNAERYLDEAIQSIRSQTLAEFELVIVDDASEDDSREIMKARASEDCRLKTASNQRPEGLARSLNTGLRLCRGEFIARMDADDRACRNRLSRQVKHLRQDEKLVVLGSNARYINSQGCSLGRSDMPLTDSSIRGLMMIMNPFIHSSVMLRGQLFEDDCLRYDEKLPVAQDYQLWTRLGSYGNLINLPDRLIELRLHDRSASRQHRYLQMQSSILAQKEYIAALYGGGDVGKKAVGRYEKYLSDSEGEEINRPLSTYKGCGYAIEIFENQCSLKKGIPPKEFYRFMLMRLLRVTGESMRSGQPTLQAARLFLYCCKRAISW